MYLHASLQRKRRQDQDQSVNHTPRKRDPSRHSKEACGINPSKSEVMRVSVCTTYMIPFMMLIDTAGKDLQPANNIASDGSFDSSHDQIEDRYSPDDFPIPPLCETGVERRDNMHADDGDVCPV